MRRLRATQDIRGEQDARTLGIDGFHAQGPGLFLRAPGKGVIERTVRILERELDVIARQPSAADGRIAPAEYVAPMRDVLAIGVRVAHQHDRRCAMPASRYSSPRLRQILRARKSPPRCAGRAGAVRRSPRAAAIATSARKIVAPTPWPRISLSTAMRPMCASGSSRPVATATPWASKATACTAVASRSSSSSSGAMPCSSTKTARRTVRAASPSSCQSPMRTARSASLPSGPDSVVAQQAHLLGALFGIAGNDHRHLGRIQVAAQRCGHLLGRQLRARHPRACG
jgi:hypothetical protein